MALLSTGNVAAEVLQAGNIILNAQYELVTICARFDESVEWALDGYPTAAHWISDSLQVEVSTAREWIRIGKKVRELPQIHADFAAGDISYSKVRALTRFADRSNEAELLALAKTIPAGQLNRRLAAWSRKNQPEDVVDARQQRERGLFVSMDGDGALIATLRLPTLIGAQVTAAIDAEVMRTRGNASADASFAQRRADALVRLLTNGGGNVETEVIIHVRGDGTTLDDGTPLGESALQHLMPTAFIRAMIHDAESNPINASGRHRHPTTRQKRLVKERDRVCVNCGSDEFLQYDHVPDFAQTRHTLIEELQLRCSRCHRMRHT